MPWTTFPKVVAESERAAALAIKHREKLDRLFKGRHYTVIRSIDVGEGKRGITALGNQCRRGFQLQDDESGQFIFIGIKVLRQAAQEYDAVALPKVTRQSSAVEKDPYDKPALATLLD